MLKSFSDGSLGKRVHVKLSDWSPRLFEEKVSAPFRRVRPEERRNARLKFQVVLYWCNLKRDRGAETRPFACGAMRSSPPSSTTAAGSFSLDCAKSFPKERYTHAINRIFTPL
jgi:hypothetical protein